MAIKLYPPNIEGTIPAFYGTTLVVPFSMNKAVSKSSVYKMRVKIKSVQNEAISLILDSINDDFINEHCLFGSEHKVFSRDLYYAYEKFCKDNCLFAHNQTAFLDAVSMREGVIRNRVRINGERLRGFEGIGLNIQDSGVSCSNFTDTKTAVPSVPERSKLL